MGGMEVNFVHSWLADSENLLFVPLGVSRSSIKRPQGPAFPKKLIRRSLISVQCRREVLLLLFDMVERLINIILFALQSLDMGKKSSKLDCRL